jgi:hypothetical protein
MFMPHARIQCLRLRRGALLLLLDRIEEKGVE